MPKFNLISEVMAHEELQHYFKLAEKLATPLAQNLIEKITGLPDTTLVQSAFKNAKANEMYSVLSKGFSDESTKEEEAMAYVYRAAASLVSLKQLHAGNSMIKEIGATIFDTNISSLNLAFHSLKESEARLITNILPCTSLTDMNLSSNQIGDTGAAALAEALKTNTNLASMGLVQTEIGDTGADALAEALKTNTSLIEMSLNMNSIHSGIRKRIATLLSCNKMLKKLNRKTRELIKTTVSGKEAALNLKNEIVQHIETSNQRLNLFIEKFPNSGNEERVAILNAAKDSLSYQPAEWLKEHGFYQEATSAYLNVEAKSPYYHDARFEAFNLAYNNYINPDQDNFLQACTDALPCLLDDQHQLIQYDQDKQKTIDWIVLKAAGFEDSEETLNSISEVDRARAMQLLLLKTIAQSNINPTTHSQGLFANERAQGLKQQLAGLATIHHLSELKDHPEKIGELWKKAQAASTALPDKNNQLLVEAVTNLVSKVKEKEEKSQSTKSLK